MNPWIDPRSSHIPRILYLVFLYQTFLDAAFEVYILILLPWPNSNSMFFNSKNRLEQVDDQERKRLILEYLISSKNQLSTLTYLVNFASAHSARLDSMQVILKNSLLEFVSKNGRNGQVNCFYGGSFISLSFDIYSKKVFFAGY
jgi:hypothetical protein